MNAPSHVISALQTPVPSERVYYSAYILGGLWAHTLPPLWRARYRITSIDNANELEKRRDLHRRYGVTALPIAHLLTLDTLSEATTHPGSRHIAEIANGNARDGLSALVAAGGMGGQLLVRSNQFQNHLADQRSDILQATNGSPESIHNVVLCGMGGAVGAGSVKYVGRELELMESSLGIPVEIHYYCVGGLAMTGFSENAHVNDAATRAAMIDFVTSPAPPNVVRHLHFLELPLLGPDAENIRTRLLLLDQQFLNSYEFSKHLQRVAPNNGARCVFGNISLHHFEVIQSNASIIAIRSNLVSQIHDQLAKIKEVKPRTGLVRGETWQDRTTPLQHPSIDEILSAHWPSAVRIQEDMLLPTEAYSPKLQLDIHTVGTIDVETIDHYMSRRIESEHDIVQRKLVLGAIEQRLTQHLQKTEREAARLAASIEPQWGIVQRLSDAAVKAEGSKRTAFIQKLHVTLTSLRPLIDSRHLHQKRMQSLKVWLKLTRREALSLDQTIASLTNCLVECLSSLGPRSTEQVAVPKNVSAVLPDLITMPTYGKEVQATILDSFGAMVTREGLASITKAELPTIDSIALAVVTQSPDFSSPPLGAMSYVFTGPVLYLLPPIDPDDMEPLASAIKRYDSNAIVFFADSMDCGAAVARYRFRHFQDVESMFPGILRHDLELALKSPFAQLRFPEGTEFLDRLGIVLDSETKKLRFEPRNIVRR